MTGEGYRLMVYTAVRAASPHNETGVKAALVRALTISRMRRSLRSARPFCFKMPAHEV